jgi:hypothetical protein
VGGTLGRSARTDALVPNSVRIRFFRLQVSQTAKSRFALELACTSSHYHDPNKFVRWSQMPDNSKCVTALIRYDAARRALAAAHRVDEEKRKPCGSTPKQAGDFALQNQAAEIRIRAERRAGELLVDMQTSGERQAKERGRPTKVSSPTTLPKLGITRDQSSKWQRLARMIDDATFDKAVAQAKENDGELTTSGLLRAIREIITPDGVPTELDINLIATELARDIESQSRREKLERVGRLRSSLNPTITKRLTSALRNLAKHAADCENQISKDLADYPANGKAFQRVIRERMADQADPLLSEKKLSRLISRTR